MMTRCYHCSHEGPLTGPPFSGLCVDREACYERQLAVREGLWRDEIERGTTSLYAGNGQVVTVASAGGFGICSFCGVEGPVMTMAQTNGDRHFMCLDYRACNARACTEHGHAMSHSMSARPLGPNYCVRCDSPG